MDADDFMGAAKLWAETSMLSPTFVRNYREQILPRILSNFSASVTKQLLSRLDRPGVLNDPKSLQESIAEAKEALRLGAEIKVPLFIESNTKVKVDTRDGSYLGRVN